MSVRFDHLIIASTDKRRSAEFYSAVFGLGETKVDGHFLAVVLSDGVVLNFAEPPSDFPPQHYAFLVDDSTFDVVLERVRDREMAYWADPQRRKPGETNTNHGGRGFYFLDPDGHYLEVLTSRFEHD